MPTRVFAPLFAIGFLAACVPNHAIQTASLNSIEAPTSVSASESATPEITPTTVEGPVLSYRVAAFYYPWYGNPTIDGQWFHWTQNNHVPPDDIASDYFPALGA